jgi:magnesium-transporting ATPase (P-type)|tara:strand:- start:8760 stop:9044 length:285 start_codon:yes stop_codon:yes gene_type:complete
MKQMFNRKGQLGNLQGIIMTLVVVGIVLGAGFFILGEFMDEAEDLGQDAAVDGVNSTIEALDTVPNLLPLVVLIAMVVIILALVFTIPGARGGA